MNTNNTNQFFRVSLHITGLKKRERKIKNHIIQIEKKFSLNIKENAEEMKELKEIAAKNAAANFKGLIACKINFYLSENPKGNPDILQTHLFSEKNFNETLFKTPEEAQIFFESLK